MLVPRVYKVLHYPEFPTYRLLLICFILLLMHFAYVVAIQSQI